MYFPSFQRDTESLISDGRNFATGNRRFKAQTSDVNEVPSRRDCDINFVTGQYKTIFNFTSSNQTMPDDLSISPQLEAAISIPTSLFEQIARENDNISIFFIHYNNSTLFPVDGGQITSQNFSRRMEVGSTILAATVGIDSDLKDLENDMNVTVLFQLKISEDKV